MSEDSHSSEHIHSVSSYVKIWGILVVLLIISVVGPMAEIKVITLVTAFGIAIVKALMVAAKFMHLNVEKRYIWYLLFTGLLCQTCAFLTYVSGIRQGTSIGTRRW